MIHSPLDQFRVKEIVDIELFGYNASITNSSLFMIIAGVFIFLYFSLAFKNKKLIPTRFQISGELVYGMISNMLDQNVGAGGRKYIPLMFTLFMFILTCNLLGMIPYGFTVTSHISITFAIAMMVFFACHIAWIISTWIAFFLAILAKRNTLVACSFDGGN